MLQIILTLAIFVILVIPMGTYMYHIATHQKTFADPVFNRVDHAIYKVCRINRAGMNWKQYALHLVMTNAVMVSVGYLILRLQGLLFLNPNGIEGMESSLSFNTIISFMTNTNLQHYSGESGLSYFSQMAVIVFMMFIIRPIYMIMHKVLFGSIGNLRQLRKPLRYGMSQISDLGIHFRPLMQSPYLRLFLAERRMQSWNCKSVEERSPQLVGEFIHMNS